MRWSQVPFITNSLLSLTLASAAAGVLFGQPRESKSKGSLPEFDVREAMVSRGVPRNFQARTLVESRTKSIDVFLATRQATQPGIRIIPNRHGLPKIFLREGRALTAASNRDSIEIAKDFLLANSAVFRLTKADLDQLRVTVKDMTHDGSYLVFNQTVNGIDVFEGQIKFTLSKTGEVIQTGSSEIVPDLTISTSPGISPEAARAAALKSARAQANGTFLRAPELVVLPLDASTVRLAYRLFLQVTKDVYEILIDAQNGSLLYRHKVNVTAAQGRVWKQSPLIGSRELVTFPDGWLAPSATVTTGNNADAYLDADGNELPDALNTAQLQNGHALSSSQVFDFDFGDGTVGLNPRGFRPAAITNLFYLVNIAHDFYYDLGFTEAAGNFQTDNFGKGGVAGDAIIALAQSGEAFNNSFFVPAPDGTAPLLVVGLFTRSTSSLTDDLDSDYDGQIVVHEYGHGVSSRLVGGGTSTSCLDQIQSGAMGEGWSDYFAISYFNNPVIGAYSGHNSNRGFRRMSYEGYTFTFEDLGNTGYENHDDGEIWAATLWDLRTALGQSVTDRLVVNGLKATPCHPSMADARDAILSADLASNGGVNRAAIWTVFARHGLGYSATGIDGTILTGTVYNAASDLPPDLQSAKNPAISSNPLSLMVGVGDLYDYKVIASNPNGGTLAFSLADGPTGMTVDPAGLVRWTASFVGGRVKIVVTDGKGGRVAHGYLLSVVTKLTNNVSVSIGGEEDSLGFAYIDVPSGVPVLQVTLRNGTGDADLAVVDPDGYLDLSLRDGDNETLSFPNPAAGRWQIGVSGYLTYAGVSLTGSLITPMTLAPSAVLSGLDGVIGSETLYRVTVPSGAASFKVSTGDGTGDVDLYLRYGSPALCQDPGAVTTFCYSDKESAADGNVESITVTNPKAGDWYLDLSAFDAYSAVTLTTAITTGSPDLKVLKTHTGAFSLGQVGASYAITVTNVGAGDTTGAVSVVDSLPTGLTATAMGGTGWSCALNTLTCTRSDALAPSANYPTITVTVNVAANAPSSVTNTATVSGGGETNTGNNTASDATTINQSPSDTSPTPYALPQLAFGGGWYTALYFSNTTSSVVTIQVNFIGENGSPLSVPLAGIGSATSRTLNLNPGATVILEAPNTGDLKQGWVEASLPPGVVGYAVFRQSNQGRDQEAVVPLTTESSQTADLVYDDTLFISGVAFVNPSNQQETVTVTAYGSDGAQIGSGQVTLAARSKQAISLRSLPGLAAVAGNRGRAVFTVSSGAVSVLGLRFGGAAFTSIPASYRPGPSVLTSYSLPQLAFGGGWYTALYFSNTTSSAVSIQVNFVGDNGAPLSVPLVGMASASARTINLNPGATVILEAPNTGDLTQGWVETSLAPGVVGYAVFRQSNQGQDQEAVVPLTTESSQAASLVYDDTLFVTGVGFVNPSNQQETVTVTAYGSDGAQIGSSQVTLAARSKQAIALKSLPGLAAVAGNRGRAAFTVSSGAVSVLGLRFGGAAFTSIPADYK